MSSDQAMTLSGLQARLADWEKARETLIGLYEAGTPLVTIGMLNAMHDAIYELEQEIRRTEIGTIVSKGDSNDKTSAWHY